MQGRPSVIQYLKKYIFSALCLVSTPALHAQINQPFPIKDSVAVYPPGCYQKLDGRKFIIPGVMILYGFAATQIRSFNQPEPFRAGKRLGQQSA